MTDFFEDKPTEPQEPQEEVVEKITIGEEEFDPEDLKEIVNKGKFAREVEEKYNTKIDKVWPEYTKATQELKALREEKQEWEASKQKEVEAKPQEELTEAEMIQRAKTEAKRLGIVTVDDMDSYITNKLNTIKEAENILDQCKELEKDFKGDDGRPKFDTVEILEHMKETGIRSPAKAYKDKYEEQLDKWKEQQYAQARKKGIYTEDGSGGNREPTSVKLTKDNLEEALRDVLSPQQD